MKSKITLLTLATAMVFTSCNKEIEPPFEPMGNDGNVAAEFTTQISRAVGNSWSANDQIGIFMVRAEDSLSSKNIVNNVDNVVYKTTSTGVSGIFSPVDVAKTIYFPQSGNVDFISYYPHKPSLTKYIYPIDVSNQSNQEAIDLLYSNNAVGKNSTAPSVGFNFKHKLSKLSIKVSSSGEYTQSELEAMEVKVKGLNTNADFLLAIGIISGAKLPADIAAKTVTAGASYEAIVIPVSPLTDASIEFIIGGKTLSHKIKNPAYVAGVRYTYNLVLGGTGVSVDDTTIEDWEDDVTDPSESPIHTISSTTVDNVKIEYNSTLADSRINEIKLREVNRTTGEYVPGGFSDVINITYTPSMVTMQGAITNPGAIDIYGKGVPMTIKAVYTLNEAGLASSSTMEKTIEKETKTETTTYLYNAENQLVSVVTNNSLGEKVSECTAVWAAGNLISTVIGSMLDINQGGEVPTPPQGVKKGSSIWETYTETYVYNETINKGGALYPRTLPSIYYEHDVVGVFASVVGILGKGTKNLVSKLTDSDDYSTVFSYTFYQESLYPQYVTLSDPTEPEHSEKMTLMFNMTR